MSIRIKELISGVEYRVIQGTTETVVMELVYDSRKTKSGSMFVCIKGYQADGHDYIEEAARRGAVAIVVQQSYDWKKDRLPEQITVISVPYTRIALAKIAAAFYRYPAKEMQIIGVTGTKGKTTTTYMIREGLRQAGHKTGLIGTIEVNADGAEIGKVQAETHTTPESLELQRYLRVMADAGCDSVVMEVSSQALKMHRVDGIHFKAAVFTNLGEDHIGPGEHADMQEYGNVSVNCFYGQKFAAGNQNDVLLEEVWAQTICRKVRYMVRAGEGDDQNTQTADYVAEQVEHINLQKELGITCNVSGNVSGRLTLSMPGQYNISNGLAAMAVLKEMGVSDAVIFETLRTVQVPGRMGKIKLPILTGYRILVDYAHNAMSLKNSLKTLRSYQPKRNCCHLWMMRQPVKIQKDGDGETAGRYADQVIVTTDNPRYEDPEAIMKEIEIGLLKTNVYYTMIADRKEAVYYAIEHAQSGDMILIAGKGHENYQEIRGIRYPMNDKELVRECTQMLL